MSVQGYILFADEVPAVRAALDAVRTEAAARTICVRRCADVCSDRSRWMSLLSLVGNPALFAYMAPAIHVLVTSAPLSEAAQGTLFAMPAPMLDTMFALVGLPEPQYFDGAVHAHHDIVIPYFIPAVESYELAEVSLDQLRTPLPDQTLVPVHDTPHFKYLQGEQEAYEAYFNAHVGREMCEDHSSTTFDQLHKEFCYPYQLEDKQAYILVQPQDDQTYRILDGNHRAALLLDQGQEKVVVAVCSTSKGLY